MDVHVYTFEDRKGGKVDEFYTQDYAEAKAHAQRANLCVIDNTYTFEDSELTDDFTICADCNEQHSVDDACDMCDDCGAQPAENCTCCPECGSTDGIHDDDCVNGDDE